MSNQSFPMKESDCENTTFLIEATHPHVYKLDLRIHAIFFHEQ
jgi:hypothetical protein